MSRLHHANTSVHMLFLSPSFFPINQSIDGFNGAHFRVCCSPLSSPSSHIHAVTFRAHVYKLRQLQHCKHENYWIFLRERPAMLVATETAKLKHDLFS